MLRVFAAAVLFSVSFVIASTDPRLDAPQARVTTARGLTFEDRVAAQRAIEQVYWKHQIWPKENRSSRPAFDDVMPASVLRAKVEDYLEKSNALERWWQRPIRAQQLQAEMERIARNTRDAEILRELFSALDGDPLLIAECLARPLLANRLLRSFYFRDERFHGELRRKVERALAAHETGAELKDLGGSYRETSWKRRTEPDQEAIVGPGPDRAVAVDSEDWKSLITRFHVDGARSLDSSADPLPAGHPPVLPALRTLGPDSIEEDDASFFVSSVLEHGADHLRIATTSWPKTAFDVWWNDARTALRDDLDLPGTSYQIVLPGEGCQNDTWTPTKYGVPDVAQNTVAVWAGAEMIVWGGSQFPPGAGARYNPATDSWAPTSMPGGPPLASVYETAVWTGTEMIVFGGLIGSTATNVGSRYNPVTDTWSPTSTGVGVPARYYHSAVWTGSEMIVWGGSDGIGTSYANSGGRYNPVTDTWQATGVGTGVPSGRYGFNCVWTGTEMIVWGGWDTATSYVKTGGRYRPATNTWIATSTGAGVPSARYLHRGVWTGTEMIVWGGYNPSQGYMNSGGRYNPSTDSWVPTGTGANVPLPREGDVAVWTGTRMILWGGNLNNRGALYDPPTDTWTATSMLNAPPGRNAGIAVWTGHEMIVWGGYNGYEHMNTGGRYDPVTDSWVPTSTGGDVPQGRQQHVAAWTGSKMVVWGGDSLRALLTSGGQYDPATDSWTPTSMSSGVPSARWTTGIWTGSELIVWGGWNGIAWLNTGGRYNPVTDTWTATNVTNAPSARSGNTLVWTGTQMVVWGGTGDITGGRYDPASDRWLPTSTGANVPSPRSGPTGVWTGTEVIIWGGSPSSSSSTNTGGRYDPAADTWLPTSTGPNNPSPRSAHTAVWTGTEMLVWGGGNFAQTGGRYDPSTDSWTPTSTGLSVPVGRSGHTATWTGTDMIVWGGSGPGELGTGARYAPCTDTWEQVASPPAVLHPRHGHSAVWTGSRMIVWGGTYSTSSGASYCADLNSDVVWHLDSDGDGHGDPTSAVVSCSPPPGYAANGDDCSDSDSATYPGAPEVNDAQDNQCPGDPGYGTIDEVSGNSGFTDSSSLCWSAQGGATGYEVARSGSPDFNPCEILGTTAGTCMDDATVPPVGTVFFYLVHATSPHPGSWGQRKPAAERIISCM